MAIKKIIMEKRRVIPPKYGYKVLLKNPAHNNDKFSLTFTHLKDASDSEKGMKRHGWR